MFYKKMFGIFGILAGVVAVALYSPILIANILWLIYAGAALLALGTIATTNVNDYSTNSWTPRKVSRPKIDVTHSKDPSTVAYSKRDGVIVGYTL